MSGVLACCAAVATVADAPFALSRAAFAVVRGVVAALDGERRLDDARLLPDARFARDDVPPLDERPARDDGWLAPNARLARDDAAPLPDAARLAPDARDDER
jgi:hypothetical protein